MAHRTTPLSRPPLRRHSLAEALSAATILSWLILSTAAADTPPDAHAIVVRSITQTDRNFAAARSYIYQAKSDDKEFDGSGKLKNAHSTVYELLYIAGKEYRHQLQRDGHPPSSSEARKEQEKLDKAFDEAARLNPEERARREAKFEAERAKERERLKYIPEAYDFRLVAEPVINGRATYQIEAVPKPAYRGKYDNLLRNMKGTLWIDKRDYEWVRIDAEALNDISVGWFLARVSKGSHFFFEQTRINDDVWLPKSFALRAGARFLVKRVNVEQNVVFSNYRKFQTDSKVIPVGTIPGTR